MVSEVRDVSGRDPTYAESFPVDGSEPLGELLDVLNECTRRIVPAKSWAARKMAKQGCLVSPTGMPSKTLSPQFFTLYLHQLDNNLTLLPPNWADKVNYRHTLLPQFRRIRRTKMVRRNSVSPTPAVPLGYNSFNAASICCSVMVANPSPFKPAISPLCLGVLVGEADRRTWIFPKTTPVRRARKQDYPPIDAAILLFDREADLLQLLDVVWPAGCDIVNRRWDTPSLINW